MSIEEQIEAVDNSNMGTEVKAEIVEMILLKGNKSEKEAQKEYSSTVYTGQSFVFRMPGYRKKRRR